MRDYQIQTLGLEAIDTEYSIGPWLLLVFYIGTLHSTNSVHRFDDLYC